MTDVALLAELVVSTDAFALSDAVTAAPSLALELERVVPTTESMVEYLRVRTGGREGVEALLLEDPSVAAAERVASDGEFRLYRMEWNASATPLFGRLEAGDETLVRGRLPVDGDEWNLTFRFASRAELEDFRDYCRRRDVGFHLVRLADGVVPTANGYDVSPKQREAMIVAHRKGYFEIPRESTLAAVAEALDISTRAVSERLRRGQANLIANTLLEGVPRETSDEDGTAP